MSLRCGPANRSVLHARHRLRRAAAVELVRRGTGGADALEDDALWQQLRASRAGEEWPDALVEDLRGATRPQPSVARCALVWRQSRAVLQHTRARHRAIDRRPYVVPCWKQQGTRSGSSRLTCPDSNALARRLLHLHDS